MLHKVAFLVNRVVPCVSIPRSVCTKGIIHIHSLCSSLFLVLFQPLQDTDVSGSMDIDLIRQRDPSISSYFPSSAECDLPRSQS
jgi:hypothetical protein